METAAQMAARLLTSSPRPIFAVPIFHGRGATDVSHSALLATIDVTIDFEHHRYQLLNVGSPHQLDVHADVIEIEGKHPGIGRQQV